MNHSAADIIRNLLVDLELGNTPPNTTWPIYASQVPDTPDNAILVKDAANVIQGRIHRTGELLEQHGITILIRGTSHTVGFAKAAAILSDLDTEISRESVNIGSNYYAVHSIMRTTGILSLGRETPESRRLLFTINAVASIRQTT